jgi:CheY-like chemotaxis protein
MTLRCVVVDDSTCFLRSALRLLDRQGVLVVGVATTGAEAARRAVELQPDVLLLDVDLGSENGFDVARRLDREGHLAASKIILISADAEEDLADLVAASPTAGFLAKADLSAAAILWVLERPRQGNGASPGDDIPRGDDHRADLRRADDRGADDGRNLADVGTHKDKTAAQADLIRCPGHVALVLTDGSAGATPLIER